MEATSFGGMLGFGPTLQLIVVSFRSFLEVPMLCEARAGRDCGVFVFHES
jgi:hypothetical protein